jgi:hypothetical protein
MCRRRATLPSLHSRVLNTAVPATMDALRQVPNPHLNLIVKIQIPFTSLQAILRDHSQRELY